MSRARYPDLIPTYEHERLEALRPYQVLGTPGQGLFNDFVGVVAKLFDTPIALVSLVRDTDVVFVGNQGLSEVPVANREDSMCSVAILQDGLTVFEDLATQPCALVDPFAAQQLRLGFYAGQSLRAPDGMPIGSLCVIDRKPRQLSAAEGELLKDLALVAQDLLLLQAKQTAADALSLRSRFDGPLQQSFARLATLAELQQYESAADSTQAQHYADSSIDEARYLAQTMRRELQAMLAAA